MTRQRRAKPLLNPENQAEASPVLARMFHDQCRYRAGYCFHKGQQKERRIGEDGRLRKYPWWNQDARESGGNL
ncbi:hypothetical protein [Acidihalobacter ferrooxydans]|uniref:hypothetical protein n=1 Tax=Acidihalobacter ferrooxydans TaxID=1765967 RepID=UPI0012EB935E|nr:hypothetical protein [Acidihalobacter ferrooxydans]